MEDSRSDDERPEQKEEDPGATRRDNTASRDAHGLRKSGGQKRPSTSTARRESDEAVSETKSPTETQEPGGQERPSTSDAPAKQESDETVSETESPTETQEEGEASQTTRKTDQDTECRPASTVDSPEESESPERMDPSVVPPVDSSAPAGAQPSEIAQPPGYSPSIGNASAYSPLPSYIKKQEMRNAPPSAVDSSAPDGSQLSESAQSPETAAKIESNETVSETESPTEIQEEDEANQTSRNADQNTGSRPNTSVDPLEGLESTEQVDSLESSTVAPPAAPSATTSAQPSESAQLEGSSPLSARGPLQQPLPPYAPEAGKGPPPPSYHPRSPRDENSTDSLALAYQRPLPRSQYISSSWKPPRVKKTKEECETPFEHFLFEDSKKVKKEMDEKSDLFLKKLFSGLYKNPKTDDDYQAEDTKSGHAGSEKKYNDPTPTPMPSKIVLNAMRRRVICYKKLLQWLRTTLKRLKTGHFVDLLLNIEAEINDETKSNKTVPIRDLSLFFGDAYRSFIDFCESGQKVNNMITVSEVLLPFLDKINVLGFVDFNDTKKDINNFLQTQSRSNSIISVENVYWIFGVLYNKLRATTL